MLPWANAVIVIGSLAAGRADGASDIDMLIGGPDRAFPQAWTSRTMLRVSGAVLSWDHWPDEGGHAGTHKWLTPDFVLVGEIAYDDFKARLRRAALAIDR